jgi:hypothetical protein
VSEVTAATEAFPEHADPGDGDAAAPPVNG